MMLYTQQRQDWIRSRRERRKLAKSARLRRQGIRYFLLVVLLLVGGLGFKCLGWAITDPDKGIVVDGNKVVSVEQVRSVLFDCVGKPLYKLDPRKLEQEVESLQAVKYAFVRRYILPYPHLAVTVLEEFPWASFATGPELAPEAVVAQTGRIIPVDRFPGVIQPEFKVYGSKELKLDSARVAQWASWSQYIAEQTGRKVDSVDLRNPDDIRVMDGDLCLKVGTADSTLTRRLGRLASVLPALAELKGSLQYIDLSLDNSVPLKLADKGDRSAKSYPSMAGSQELPVQNP